MRLPCVIVIFFAEYTLLFFFLLPSPIDPRKFFENFYLGVLSRWEKASKQVYRSLDFIPQIHFDPLELSYLSIREFRRLESVYGKIRFFFFTSDFFFCFFRGPFNNEILYGYCNPSCSSSSTGAMKVPQ